MTPAARRALARVLGALRPWRTSGRLMDDPCKAHAAAMGAESLAGSSFETSRL